MPRVTYSRHAKDDLIDIWLWIARDSQASADAMIDRIEQRAAMLADYPEMGAGPAGDRRRREEPCR